MGSARGFVLAVALCLVGCGPDVACPLVLALSGVKVQTADGVFLRQLCIGDVCQGGPAALVVLDSDDPAVYDYELTVVLDDGSEVVTAGEVATEEFFVNGPRCEPRTANATLYVDEFGGVRISNP